MKGPQDLDYFTHVDTFWSHRTSLENQQGPGRWWKFVTPASWHGYMPTQISTYETAVMFLTNNMDLPYNKKIKINIPAEFSLRKHTLGCAAFPSRVAASRFFFFFSAVFFATTACAYYIGQLISKDERTPEEF